MHEGYRSTARMISEWAAADADVKGVVLIGSQVRRESPGDLWSDLDVLIFSAAPEGLKEDSEWLGLFGRPVCVTKEVVRIDSMNLAWFVQRPLYDDFRAVDFSILPYDRMDDALKLNKEIHHHGYEVIHDDAAGSLGAGIERSLRETTPTRYPVPDESEFSDIVNDLLYHVIWAYRKVRRKELWTAVSCINCYMRGRLLRLVETLNAASSRNTPGLFYDGKLLESRTPPSLLARLRDCFSKYDGADAVAVLDALLEIIHAVARDAGRSLGYAYNNEVFESIKSTHAKMKLQPDANGRASSD